jgi:glycosyltransferase involved in cell wall biosynthesis
VAVPSVLFLTSDPVGSEMGGNAIRAHELARMVGRHAPTVLAGPAGEGAPPDGVATEPFDPARPEALRPLIDAADVIVTPPQGAVTTSWLRRSKAVLVYDLYDPGALEALEIHAGASPVRRRFWTMLAVDHLLDALHLGNHFICATERQRDLWLGAMVATRLLTPPAYDADPTLRSVIDVVPFGMPENPPEPTDAGGVRARFPQIRDDAEIVLWNGGIWNWLDPETAVHAVALLARRRPRLRLVFMGRPPLGETDARAARAARDVASKAGLLDRIVFFNDAWVPYAQRSAWLLDANCALSTHLDHLETRFAFRTRLLDCLWARVPVVCTEGDELAERILGSDLGAVAPPGDAAALASALERVLDRGKASYAAALAGAASELSWPAVAGPLIRYVMQPDHPRRLGDDWDRRASRPMQRLRAAAIRAGRRTLRVVRRGVNPDA